MNCGDYQQNILLMIHGELGFVERMRVKAHLSQCADCRKTYDALTTASRMIGAAIRSPEMARWAPASAGRQYRIPTVGTIVGLLIILASGVFLTAIYFHDRVNEILLNKKLRVAHAPPPPQSNMHVITCCVKSGSTDDKCKYTPGAHVGMPSTVYSGSASRALTPLSQ